MSLLSIARRLPFAAAAEPLPYCYYSIGDGHGYDDAMGRLLDKIEEKRPSIPALRTGIILLGDYINRGPRSCEMLDRLCAEKKKSEQDGVERIFLKGNHESGFLHFLLDEIPEDKDLPTVIRFFLDKGGLTTLASYGVHIQPASRFEYHHVHTIEGCHLRVGPKEVRKAQLEMLQAIPREHLEFLDGLRTSFETEDFFFTHAGVNPDLPLHLQHEETLLGLENGVRSFNDCDRKLEKVVVHGHTPVKSPFVNKAQVSLDSGVYKRGILSAAILTPGSVKFLQSCTDYPAYDRRILPQAAAGMAPP